MTPSRSPPLIERTITSEIWAGRQAMAELLPQSKSPTVCPPGPDGLLNYGSVAPSLVVSVSAVEAGQLNDLMQPLHR